MLLWSLLGLPILLACLKVGGFEGGRLLSAAIMAALGWLAVYVLLLGCVYMQRWAQRPPAGKKEGEVVLQCSQAAPGTFAQITVTGPAGAAC